MQELIASLKQVIETTDPLPFSVYSSVKEQRILNVPIIKPLLICVLDGCKELGDNNETICPAGSFVFLSNSAKVDMRNIPQSSESTLY